MSEALGQDVTITQYRISTPICDYQSILRDRRLKVIFLTVLNSTRRDPILTVRFSWASFVMFVTASALACHQILVSLSETYIGRVPFAPKQFAVSA
jgi:aarF domain-containing kinase